MKTRMRRSKTVERTALGATLLLGLAGGAAAQEPAQRRPLARDAAVEVHLPSHDVHVVGWEREELEATGEDGRWPEGLRIEGDRRRVEVRLEPGGTGHRGGRGRGEVDPEMERSGDLVLRVPRGVRLEIRSLAGDVTVEGVNGSVDLQTHRGDVTYSGDAPSVQANTFAGDIRIEGSATKTRIKAVNGDVFVRAAGGFLQVKTVSGDLEVLATGPVDAVTIGAVSGDVAFRGPLAADATLDLESHSGDVVLLLPPGTGAKFEVATFSGDIHNALGPEARSISEYTPEKRLEFSTGNGNARVRLQSFSGDIEIGRP